MNKGPTGPSGIVESPGFEKIMEEREHETHQPKESKHLGYASHVLADGERTSSAGEIGIPLGFIEIHSDAFPSKGMFYPSDIRFFIRAASVAEIRAFSMIDETSPFSIDDGMTNIIKNCLHIKAPTRILSYKDLKEEDKIHVVMAIREATFVKGENRLAVPVTCQGCQKEFEIEIKNSSFVPREIDESILKYYSEENRRFEIKTRSFGTINIEPPSIGIAAELTKYIQKRRNERKNIDMAFIKMMPYMVANWKELNEEKVLHLEAQFIGWDSKKYQLMNSLVEKIRVGVKDELVAPCVHCGEENAVQVTFPGGPKALFVISDISGELL